MTSTFKYSPLNSYDYAGKSTLCKTLDSLSLPVRRILGGRSVNVITNHSQDALSIAGKIARLFVAVVIFPLGAISLSSFIVKLLLIPVLGEKKQIEASAAKSQDAIKKFFEFTKANEHDKVLALLNTNPEIVQTVSVEEIVTSLIKEHAPWDKIIPFFKWMDQVNSAANLKNMIVNRMNSEMAQNCLQMDASEIILVTRQLIGRYGASEEIKFLEQLIRETFQVKEKNDFNRNIYNIDIVSKLMARVHDLQDSLAKDELTKKLNELKIGTLIHEAYENGPLSQFYPIQNDKEQLKIIHQLADSNRAANRLELRQKAILSTINAQCQTLDGWKKIKSQIEELIRDAKIIMPAQSPYSNLFNDIGQNLSLLLNVLDKSTKAKNEQDLQLFQAEAKQTIQKLQAVTAKWDELLKNKNSPTFEEIQNKLKVLQNPNPLLSIIQNKMTMARDLKLITLISEIDAKLPIAEIFALIMKNFTVAN